MDLRYLSLSKTYGSEGYPLEGSATFIVKHGEVKLRLTQRHIEQILRICADAIVESSREVAADLTADIVTQNLTAIEGAANEPIPPNN